MKKLLTFLALSGIFANALESQDLIKDFGNNHISTTAISFTSDGKYMIVGGFAKLYDLAAKSEYFRTLKEDTETQGDYAFTVSASSDNRSFLLTKINMIEIWDLQSQTILKSIRDSRLAEKTACFSGDGKSIIYMRTNGEIVFVNSSTYIESYKQNIMGEAPTSLSASPDGKKLFIGTRSNNIFVYDINNGRSSSFKIDSKEICQIEFPGTGDYIAVSSADGRIWLGKYPSLEKISSFKANAEGYTAIAFHPSGKYLASGGKDKILRIWSIPDCNMKYAWEAHKLALLSVAFSPDGKSIASGSLNDPFGRGEDTKIWSFRDAPAVFLAAKNSTAVQAPVSVKVQSAKPDESLKKRLALIIGNGNYPNSFLANPGNDAREMKKALLQYGFDVLEYENLNQGGMKTAMDDFGDKLKGYDVGLFFYAGHGIQAKGYNYLIPVDANLKSEGQVEYDCVQADRILALMESSGARVNIIILDACRNNPFERSWTRSADGKGLAGMNAPRGSLIAFATAPGSTASDGSGNNGLYTSAILESIKIPDINIIQIFQNVRKIVLEKSGGEQMPWESTSLIGDFFF